GLDDAAVMFGDFRIDYLGAERLQPAERPLLVGSDQARITRYIGSENCDQAARRALVFSREAIDRRNRGSAVDPGHRRDKPITPRRDRLNAAPFRSSLIEYSAERRDLDRQIGILDHRPSPDGGYDLLFQDEIAGPLDKRPENIECSRPN